MTTACLVDSCDQPRRARGWCNPHYQRWAKHGDPLGGRGARYRSPEDAFVARTEPLAWSGCLIWTGSVNSHGYGQIGVNGLVTAAHRYAWEREHGPIPEGMKVDHRYHCDPACCETSHLRLATNRQNMQNRSGAQRGSGTGVRNVHRSRDRYCVRIKVDGVERRFGAYDTVEEAARVAASKRAELFGEFAGRGGQL